MTSPAFISAYFPWVPGRKGPIVSQARQLQMLHLLHIFFVQLSNNEDNSVQNAIKFFCCELCFQIHGIYCHITAKLDRFLSEPAQVQVKPKAGYFLPDGPSSPFSHIVTSTHLPEGLRLTVVLCPPLSGTCAVIGGFVLLCQFVSAHLLTPYYYFPV